MLTQQQSDQKFSTSNCSRWAQKRPAPWRFNVWIIRPSPNGRFYFGLTFDEQVEKAKKDGHRIREEVDVYPEGAVCWWMDKKPERVCA